MKTPTYWYSVERNEVATVPMHRESLYQITIHRRSAFSTVSRFFFSLFFFLPPSADTARNRLPTIEIDYYGRFWMITGRKQSQSVVPPGSRRSCTGQLALANAGFSTISFLLGTTTPLVSGFLFFSPHAWEEGTRRQIALWISAHFTTTLWSLSPSSSSSIGGRTPRSCCSRASPGRASPWRPAATAAARRRSRPRQPPGSESRSGDPAVSPNPSALILTGRRRSSKGLEVFVLASLFSQWNAVSDSTLLLIRVSERALWFYIFAPTNLT
ncbi:hypothetical protein GW17_00037467 [Ensete ventricosum]|nr:hypothetical protein GW17_00037467 [Ensete ventricosum]